MTRLVIGIILLLGLFACTTTPDQYKASLRANIDPISIKDQVQYERDVDECAQIASDYTNAHKGEMTLQALSATHVDKYGNQRPGFRGIADIQRNCMLNRGYLYLK